MTMIKKPIAWKVALTEYERGWGSKPFDTVYFTTEQEAREYARDYNETHNNQDVVPAWYVVATYEGLV
jgi:hypothetical protein